MMRPTEIIQGNKYIFKIECNSGIFGIKAQCKSTKRYSYINNLNVVLSEFGLECWEEVVGYAIDDLEPEDYC